MPIKLIKEKIDNYIGDISISKKHLCNIYIKSYRNFRKSSSLTGRQVIEYYYILTILCPTNHKGIVRCIKQYDITLSIIGCDRVRQRMSGTIVGMNCHPHLLTRSILKHPILDNVETHIYLRKEQPITVFNSKVSTIQGSDFIMSIDSCTSILNTDTINQSKKKNRKSRWFNKNRKTLNKERSVVKEKEVSLLRLNKSRLRLEEKQTMFEDVNKKLEVLERSSQRTKGTVRYSHRLLDVLDELENAKNELHSCKVFHNKASTLRYRIPKTRTETNTKLQTQNTSSKKYNLRKQTITNTNHCIGESEKGSSSSDHDHSSISDIEEYIPYDYQRSKDKICTTKERSTIDLGIYDESDDNGSSTTLSQVLHLSNQWVYDLKAMDDKSQPFFSKCLVIIRGIHKQWENKSWKDITIVSAKDIITVIHEIIFIQRNGKGQMYVVQGLQKSLHFSLGSHGTQTLIDYCSKANVKVWKGSSTLQKKNRIRYSPQSFIPRGLYVNSMKQSQLSIFERTYQKLMKKVANGLWSTLFGVSLLLHYDHFH